MAALLQKYIDVIGPECADSNYVNCALAMFYKNTWHVSKKSLAIKIGDYENVAKDKICHGAGVTNGRKLRHRNK